MMEWGADPGVQGCSSFAGADGPGGQLRWGKETGRWGVGCRAPAANCKDRWTAKCPNFHHMSAGMLQQP